MRANRYVSYLAAEIEPRALSTISQFEKATEAAFARIEAFSNKGASKLGIGGIVGIDSKSRAAIGQTESALAGVRAEASRVAPAVKAVAAETSIMSTAFLRSAQALNVVQGPLGPLAGRLSSLGYIFKDLAGISLAGVLGGGGAFALAGIASSYQKITDRLRPFYDNQQDLNAALRQVITIAGQTRQSLDPIAELYARIAVAGKDAGVSAKDVSRITETVAKAARLSGGSQDTQQAGITQFAQAFGAGTFQGQDLRAIKDDTFALAKAIADGLGVPISKLRDLGAEGKLTTTVVVQALKRSTE